MTRMLRPSDSPLPAYINSRRYGYVARLRRPARHSARAAGTISASPRPAQPETTSDSRLQLDLLGDTQVISAIPLADTVTTQFEAITEPIAAEPTSGLRARLTSNTVLNGFVSLMGTTLVTSGAGFVFWIIAARVYPQIEVGRATTLVAAIALFSAFGAFGLDTTLISELAKHPSRISTLMPAAMTASALMSGMLALLCSVVVMTVGHTGLRVALGGSWVTAFLLTVSVALYCAVLVFDQGTLGIQSSRLMLIRNIAVSLGRLLLVGVFGLAIGRDANSVLLSWLVAVVVSLLVVAPAMRKQNVSVLRPRSPVHLRGLATVVADHNTLNLSIVVPRMAIPLIVAAFHPGGAAAAFYIAWMIVSFLYFVPTHLCNSLFAVAVGDLATLRTKVRFTLMLCGVLGVLAIPVLCLIARPLLLVFGHGYATLATGWLIVLGLQYFALAIKEHFAAVLRAQGHVRRAGWICAAGATTELVVLSVTLAHSHVLQGCIALAIVLYIEAVIMAPVLIRAVATGHVSANKQINDLDTRSVEDTMVLDLDIARSLTIFEDRFSSVPPL